MLSDCFSRYSSMFCSTRRFRGLHGSGWYDRFLPRCRTVEGTSRPKSDRLFCMSRAAAFRVTCGFRYRSIVSKATPPFHDSVSPISVQSILPRQYSRNSCLNGYIESSDGSRVEQVTVPTSAYVHLPFCRRRCYYCDFAVVAVGERNENNGKLLDSTMAKYTELICKEIAITGASNNPGIPLKTVFFGGGTPSLLPNPMVLKILKCLQTHFGICNDAEISMEMDPGTFDVEKLRGLLGSGINRISLGVQCFQDELLQACGRAHGLKEVYEAIDVFRTLGLENWSLDLISSLPNQTMEQWERSLKEAILASPQHISVYDLQIEEGTLFNRWYKAGQFPLPTDEKSASFYRTAAMQLKQAGYEHYEVSNYAKQGYQCLHNLVYWKNWPYYGFGLGATSYVGNCRISRPRSMREYTSFIESLEIAGTITEYPQDSDEEKILDTLMLSLRLSQGLILKAFRTRFGPSIAYKVCKEVAPFLASGHMEALDGERRVIPVERYTQFLRECTLLNAKSSQSKHGNDVLSVKDRTFWQDTSSDTVNIYQRNVTEDHPHLVDQLIYVDGYSLKNSVLRSPSEIDSSNQYPNFEPVYLRLSDPDGFLLSNEIISSIFSALPSGISYAFVLCLIPVLALRRF